MKRLPRWFGNFARWCCPQNLVLEIKFSKVSDFLTHFEMVSIIVKALHNKRTSFNKKGENGIKIWKLPFLLCSYLFLRKFHFCIQLNFLRIIGNFMCVLRLILRLAGFIRNRAWRRFSWIIHEAPILFNC